MTRKGKKKKFDTIIPTKHIKINNNKTTQHEGMQTHCLVEEKKNFHNQKSCMIDNY